MNFPPFFIYYIIRLFSDKFNVGTYFHRIMKFISGQEIYFQNPCAIFSCFSRKNVAKHSTFKEISLKIPTGL